MRVGILGPLHVEADGATVEIGGLRLRAVLARLALDAGRSVSTESLCQALWPSLWPESAPENPSHALHSLITRLRRALPDGSLLRSAPTGYLLDVPPEAVDAQRFERLARQGRRALGDGHISEAHVHLHEALELWRGEALADLAPRFPYAANAAVRLEELRLGVLEDRIDADLKSDADTGSLAAELEELTTAHPFRERMRGLLIRALHLDGRQPEALTAYDRYRRFLAEELGTDPGPEIQDLHLTVLQGKRPARGNLRAPLTSFVGREHESAQLSELLADNRLVTLVGPGGVGKTRLATATVTDAWFVDLAPVSDPGEVPRTVAAALDVHEAGRATDVVLRLAESLRSAGTPLLILDNCEQVIDAAARLVHELLGRCPHLTILATSREPLAITGEALLPVPPLGEDPATRLFLDRAQAVQPGFRIDAQVAAICRRLDGLPLAIELAAARLRSMSLDHLAARLDDRFRVLTGGSRTALPRHRTLRGVVAWSWDLLSETERDAAESLTVFPGTFAPSSAQHTGVALETLDALVDKSLLQLDGTRYRMLDTIREFGQERLAETGRLEAARQAFLACFLDLAEQAEPHLRGPGQLPWLARLNAERDNLLTALRYASDADSALRLGAALSPYWTIQGDHVEATNRLHVILSMPGGTSVQARVKVLFGYRLNAVFAGELTRAAPVLEEGHGEDATGAHVLALQHLASANVPAGLRALEPYLAHPDPWTRGMTWMIRSFMHSTTNGAAAEGRRDLNAAVAAFRESGDRWGLSLSLASVAFDRTATGDFDATAAALEESTDVIRGLGPDNQQRIWLAMVRVHTGELEKARAELLSAMADTTSAYQIALGRLLLADLARFRGDLDEAARQLDLADAEATDLPAQTLYFSSQGHLALAQGDLALAKDALNRSLSAAITMPDMPMIATIAVGMAQLLHHQDNPRQAAELLGAAHALRDGPDTRHPDVQNLTQALKTALGTHAYQDAYERGRTHPAPLTLITEAHSSPVSDR